MIDIHNSKDITLEICQEIKKLAREAKACKVSYVPFLKAIRKKDLEECVAIINGEHGWLYEEEILPYDFIRNGRTVNYHENGQKYFEFNFTNNLRDGKYECLYDNGQKQITGLYIDGKREGLWTYYNFNGQKCEEINYVNSVRHGKYDLWDENGKMFSYQS